MKIVLTGGGSGGHITPILAIAAQIKKIDPSNQVIFIGQKGDRFADITNNEKNIDEIYLIRAGKFRRYHGEGIKQIYDFKTLYLNIRDFFMVFIGLLQSILLIHKIKPGIVFSRGGYVSVPVCLGAKVNKVSYITHDSDLMPSLANRIISPWAKYNFVAFPKELYKNYSSEKAVTTGVPISENYKKVDKKLKAEYRKTLGIKNDARMVFVIGGGLGSRVINNAIIDIAPHILEEFNNLELVMVLGNTSYESGVASLDKSLSDEQRNRVKLFEYINNVHEYSGAADVIVARAGATNLAEFSTQGKACIIIPSTTLAGGHQIRNAEVFAKNDSAIILRDEDITEDPNKLAKQISLILKDGKERERLEKVITNFSLPDAANKIAKLVIEAAR